MADELIYYFDLLCQHYLKYHFDNEQLEDFLEASTKLNLKQFKKFFTDNPIQAEKTYGGIEKLSRCDLENVHDLCKRVWEDMNSDNLDQLIKTYKDLLTKSNEKRKHKNSTRVNIIVILIFIFILILIKGVFIHYLNEMNQVTKDVGKFSIRY